MRIGLIPLDERPVNTRYPAMIAAIAGVDLVLPPADLLSSFRTPAPCDDLAEWLRDSADELDALVVSLEMLAYGGLIASRITSEPAEAILPRLNLLRDLRAHAPGLTILGFNLITRISNANWATEEPPYWATYGTRMYRFSQLIDRQARGEPVEAELAALRTELPAADLHDFLRRRLRNHTINLAALQLAIDGVLDLLVLSSDDTSPYGLPTREKRWLSAWAGLLSSDERLLMYPGADEVGSALVGRLINQHAGRTPHFEAHYAVPGGEEVVAPFEDGPVRVTVERQVRAVGGTIGAGDIWVGVNPPVPRRSEWSAAHAEVERAERLPYLQALADQAQQQIDRGRLVIIADVAYPNGADPVLVDLLRERVQLPGLAAYGAWNTAGNTIGTALAHGCAARLASTPAARAAHERFLVHRFVEDWGYQQVVRRQARAWLVQTTGTDEPGEANLEETTAWIEERLSRLIDDLPGFAGRYRIVPGSTWLPWRRLFEVDFTIESVHG